jgi:hypothetical protein
MRCLSTLLLIFASFPCIAQDGNPQKHRQGLELPDAPQPAVPQPPKPGFWTFGKTDGPKPLRTTREVLRDKTFWITEGTWLGAVAFDAEEAHLHPGCSALLGDYEDFRRRSLYQQHAAEYLVGSGFNWLLIHYVSKSLILVNPGISGTIYVRRGMRAVTAC